MWITEIPSQRLSRERHSIYSENGERTRKHHHKSKGGCVYCKRRRIKCDERKPSCSNCMRRQRLCSYGTGHGIASRSQTSRTRLPSPHCDTQLITGANERHLFDALALESCRDPDLADFAPVARLYALESLKHFQSCDQLWLKTRKVQMIMQNSASSLIMDHPHLLHAVLAMSAAHLAKLKPEPGSYWMSSMIHWQHSLRAYSACFSRSLETQNIDAIYFSSQLQSILAFLFAQRPFQPGAQRPAWVTSMQGTHILLHVPEILARLRKGIWHSLVDAHDQWEERSRQNLEQNHQFPTSRAISALTSYCNEMDPTNASLNDDRLEFLKVLERCPPRPEAINAFTSYINHAPPEYVAKVKSGDRTALILLIYWCKLFSTAGQWWIKDSAQSEIQRLTALVSLGGDHQTNDILDVILENT